MKKKKLTVKIIVPKRTITSVEEGLIKLTKALSKRGVEISSGFLGGEYGYGANYENDVFMMKPYCWCDDEKCNWCYGNWPNFWFKPTDGKIYWYKYIGRSQTKEGKFPKNWLEVCIKSIKTKKCHQK